MKPIRQAVESAIRSASLPPAQETRLRELLIEPIIEAVVRERTEFVNLDTPARLARVLLEMADSGGLVTAPASGDFAPATETPITQAAIASRAGSVRSYVSTLVNQWKRKRILAVEGRLIRIKDLPRLQALAAIEER